MTAAKRPRRGAPSGVPLPTLFMLQSPDLATDMSDLKHTRNFGIIAHIDHGKSTLSDRMLELTETVESRKMKEQLLDQMELERERGITIKMQPVRMQFEHEGEKYTLNLLDTPGHIDFSYEVSRALKAVEGVLLLVDATQGVQAQTLSVLEMAKEQGLTIIPVLNKIDLPLARPDEITLQMIDLLGCEEEDVLHVSAKTGEGVPALLETIVAKFPSPKTELENTASTRGLVFDFAYDTHRGVIIYTRLVDGSVKKGDKLKFIATDKEFNAIDVGVFTPEEHSTGELGMGSIGYIVTGLKEPGVARVGDTVTFAREPLAALPGYEEPKPVVWASVYPEDQDDFVELRKALERLQLSDSSLSFEEESSGTLGRGFRCGFLGMLHMEIVIERLKREFNLSLVVATPTITYEVKMKDGSTEKVYSAVFFPDEGTYTDAREPWVNVRIISPSDYVGPIVQLFHDHEVTQKDVDAFGDGRMQMDLEMPLRELMRNFFDEVKSASSGYASLSYQLIGLRDANIERLDILIADEVVPAFSRVVARARVQEEAEETVKKLKEVLPKQQFELKIQAKAHGRIIAAERKSAMRKDVTGALYGGDVTRKRKLLEKQKKGKKKLKEQGKGKVHIPQDVFMKMTQR